MAYTIDGTYAADDDILRLRPVERSAIKKALPKYLRDTPTLRSTHRKRMEPNPLDVPWELRLGALRVFYFAAPLGRWVELPVSIDATAHTVTVTNVDVSAFGLMPTALALMG